MQNTLETVHAINRQGKGYARWEIGCAIELFERGRLQQKDVGYPLSFGNVDALVDLVEKMATRDGFGWILGEGSYRHDTGI